MTVLYIVAKPNTLRRPFRRLFSRNASRRAKCIAFPLGRKDCESSRVNINDILSIIICTRISRFFIFRAIFSRLDFNLKVCRSPRSRKIFKRQRSPASFPRFSFRAIPSELFASISCVNILRDGKAASGCRAA